MGDAGAREAFRKKIAGPLACPVCGVRILYTDGQMTPDLIFRANDLRPFVAFCIGCERCLGQAPVAPRKPLLKVVPAPEMTPPKGARPSPGQTMLDETKAVVGWLGSGLDMGLEALGKVSELVRKLQGKKPR
jgi:hypothetical protein